MYKKIKRAFIIIVSVLFFLFVLAGMGVYIWCEIALRENIQKAKSLHPGKAEDALIAFLLDSTISVKERSTLAIWTLGQIQSQKARPVLLKFYKNEPCKGRHDTEFCQYEINKALNNIQSNGWLFHEHLNK